CNVGMAHNEIRNCSIFRQRKRIFIGPSLYVIRLPVPAEIPVWIVAPCPIFIYLPISIVVNAFTAQQLINALLTFWYPNQATRVVWILNKLTIWAFAAHCCNMSITVQIIKFIFIDQSVAIVINRNLPGSRRMLI